MSSLPPSSEGNANATALDVEAESDPAMLHLLNLVRSGIAVPEAVEAAASEVPGGGG